ncbi:unnamed protein product [Adineta ricciae]|uniref:Uncharacterized protein n=1 Tax=Adineta ricciae TaxID=249248 RepID=A0A814I9M0_ADIRI|nr:unnamed protein product [Adineta ricciae]
MREPMSILALSNRQRLHVNPPKLIPLPDSFIQSNKAKRWRFYEESLQDMKATGKSVFPHSGGNYIVDFSLTASDRDINYDQKPVKRRRKRPIYRQSIYHSLLTIPAPIELSNISARGRAPEVSMTMPPVRIPEPPSVYQHNAPPPTPQNDESEQSSRQSQDKSTVRPFAQKLMKGKERQSQFHLPALNLSVLSRQEPKKLSAKEVRSTLSNYLQNFY